MKNKKISCHFKKNSAFSIAIGAGSEKVYPVSFDIKIGRAADFLVDFREEVFLEILYFAAFPADKVVVRFGFGLEPVESAAGIYFSSKTKVDKNREISIDCAEAEPGKLRFELIVKPRGCRVAFGRAKNFQDAFSLSAVSVVFFRRFLLHGPKLFVNGYYSGNVLFPYHC